MAGIKKIFLISGAYLMIAAFAGRQLCAQVENQRMVRIYEDNDALKIFGKISDRAYSNGTRLEYFFTPGKTNFFLHKLMPKAGQGSQDSYGIGVMQVMITPKDLRRYSFVANDYRYAGALFLLHSLHSTNESKQFNLQSEWILGVMGPPAMAKETQVFLHKLVDFVRPRGWDNQLPTDLLLNYNLAMEKGFPLNNRSVEFIGGGKVFLGTMLNGASIYTQLRVGKMHPYFKKYTGQFTSGSGSAKRLQYYLTIRPAADYILYNALIEGGLFSKNKESMQTQSNVYTNPSRRRLIGQLDIGAVVWWGRLGLSYTRKTSTGMIRGLPHHSIGNISVYYGW